LKNVINASNDLLEFLLETKFSNRYFDFVDFCFKIWCLCFCKIMAQFWINNLEEVTGNIVARFEKSLPDFGTYLVMYYVRLQIVAWFSWVWNTI